MCLCVCVKKKKKLNETKWRHLIYNWFVLMCPSVLAHRHYVQCTPIFLWNPNDHSIHLWINKQILYMKNSTTVEYNQLLFVMQFIYDSAFKKKNSFNARKLRFNYSFKIKSSMFSSINRQMWLVFNFILNCVTKMNKKCVEYNLIGICVFGASVWTVCCLSGCFSKLIVYFDDSLE